jgi:hypothetical protein
MLKIFGGGDMRHRVALAAQMTFLTITFHYTKAENSLPVTFQGEFEWLVAFDAVSKRFYYYHPETRETRWDLPLAKATSAFAAMAFKSAERATKSQNAAEAHVLEAHSHAKAATEAFGAAIQVSRALPNEGQKTTLFASDNGQDTANSASTAPVQHLLKQYQSEEDDEEAIVRETIRDLPVEPRGVRDEWETGVGVGRRYDVRPRRRHGNLHGL